MEPTTQGYYSLMGHMHTRMYVCMYVCMYAYSKSLMWIIRISLNLCLLSFMNAFPCELYWRCGKTCTGKARGVV